MSGFRSKRLLVQARWTQPHPTPTRIDTELIAQRMIAEMLDIMQLEESQYKEATAVINYIKSLKDSK
jgi:hypothetical protein